MWPRLEEFFGKLTILLTFFTISESAKIQYLLPKSNYIIKFTMICVNFDIYTVK